MTTAQILVGDCRQTLHDLEDGSVQCCVTSPPPWGAPPRLPVDHPDAGRAVGSALSPYRHVAELAGIFRIVRHKLRGDGTLWLHLSDVRWNGSLFGLPWRVAILMEAEGWRVVADLAVREFPDPPQSLEPDSPAARSHLFVLAKSARYRCDDKAIAVPLLRTTFAHDAIVLGSELDDTVLDPFGADGRIAEASLKHGRHAVLCELSPTRAETARERLKPFGEIG